jgi:hypothetical protein
MVLWVGFFLAVPLWREFHEPSQPVWNVFLTTFLIALVVGTFFGVRYLQKKGVEVGERVSVEMAKAMDGRDSDPRHDGRQECGTALHEQEAT